MKKVVIFGTGKIADVVYWCFRELAGYQVEAFTCHREYIKESSLWELPVVPFEEIEKLYSPELYNLFVAIGYHELNETRAGILECVQEKGYGLVNCISPKANISSAAKIGDNCLIMDGVSIQPCAKIGSNVFLWSNTLIAHHAIVQDHCWFASESVIGGSSIIEPNCFIGLNATVGHEVKIGKKSFLGAGVMVLKDAAEKSVYVTRETEKFRLDSERFLSISKLQ